MMRALIAVAAVLSLAAPASAADRYTVTDKGGFGSTGRLVEFASRYGWHAYEVEFDFGVDLAERRLTRKSKLTLKITRNDGSTWKYRCRAKDDRWMWANINRLYGKGISVLTECRIDPEEFADAVDMDSDLVGDPTLVFHVMIRDGKAEAGIHKGFYFLEQGDIYAGGMNQYASRTPDPSKLGVLFASAMAPYQHHPHYAAVPRFMP